MIEPPHPPLPPIPRAGGEDPTAIEGAGGTVAACLWLTGLPGAGKTTLAHALAEALRGLGERSYVCDGDALRAGLSRDLGLAPADRAEHARRTAEVARLFVDAGLIAIVALVSPYRADRAAARALFAPGQFMEVFCRCPVEICAVRTGKVELYRRALAGEIQGFTGISAPYEAPEAAEFDLATAALGVAECVEILLHGLRQRGHLPGGTSADTPQGG